MEISSAMRMRVTLNMPRVVLILLTVFGEIDLIKGNSSPIYTWPLYRGDFLKEIQRDNNGDKLGCSVSPGATHTDLGYESVHMTGSSSSYIDVTIESTNEIEFDDFGISIFAKSSTPTGGTLFHYKQDDSTVDSNIEKAKEVILWYNQTHIAVEIYGPNGEEYVSVTVQFNSDVDTWVGFAFSSDNHPHSKLKLVTDNGINTEEDTEHVTLIGQPGILRIGSTFDSVHTGFNGDMICVSMYDSKINLNDLASNLEECEFKEEWADGADVEGASDETCDALKGYFEVMKKDSAIDLSVTILDNMATMSLIQCASFCFRTGLCWSFTLDKIAGSCKLFDDDYSSRITSSTGTHYYMRLDVCC